MDEIQGFAHLLPLKFVGLMADAEAHEELLEDR
jgi:hypothetical protein